MQKVFYFPKGALSWILELEGGLVPLVPLVATSPWVREEEKERQSQVDWNITVSFSILRAYTPYHFSVKLYQKTVKSELAEKLDDNW